MESIKEDTKVSKEDKEIIKRKFKHHEENIEKCNPINPGVVSRGELYLIDLFFI